MFGENIKWHLQANYNIVVFPHSYSCCILMNHALWLNPDFFLFLLFIPKLCKGIKMKGRELLWFLQIFFTFSQFSDILNQTQSFLTVGLFYNWKVSLIGPKIQTNLLHTSNTYFGFILPYPTLSYTIVPYPFSCILITFQSHDNLDYFYPFFSYNEGA